MTVPSAHRFGPFELHPLDRRLIREGKAIPLPPKAFDLLVFLVANAGRLVTRDELFQAVWPDVAVEDGNLTNNITALRRVLGRHAIQSVPRHGYRFSLPVAPSRDLSPEMSDLFSQAEAFLNERTSKGVLRARDLLWLVIASEPQCAPAWAWLGRAARFLEKYGVDRDYHRKLVDLAFARAFSIDPALPCAHQYFTVVQVDRGEALSALRRLLTFAKENHADVHCFAALVQVCRFCGLQDASMAAHGRAKELDRNFPTSIPHTHFARCDYEATVESYLHDGQGTRVYLDLCAWAVLGFTKRAETEALSRLRSREWPPLFKTLLESFIYALQGNRVAVRDLCLAQDLYEDPESELYLARHLAFAGHASDALRFLRHSIYGGLAVSDLLEGDPWLRSLRSCNEFKDLIQEARRLQSQAQQILQSIKFSPLEESA